jgi:hypothetical protein
MAVDRTGQAGTTTWWRIPTPPSRWGADSLPVVAAIAAGSERTRLWDKELEVAPFLAGFQEAVSWEIPVVTITPATAD